MLEEYDEETLALAVIVLSMFIHLSPDLAAPMLLDIMQSVGRYSAGETPSTPSLTLHNSPLQRMHNSPLSPNLLL